jgi:putative tryptophan/tyrosine transport system substrate-binding protein
MNRRQFITGLGSAAAWPVAARAQQDGRVRRIGVLTDRDENDPDVKAMLARLTQRLADLGWRDGRNLRIEVRSAGGDNVRLPVFARELIDLRLEVIVTNGVTPTIAVQRETRTTPIVFVNVVDPIGSGFVAGLPHPGGNLTGFMFTEPGMAGKSLQLLAEIAPGIKRAAIMFNPDTAAGGGLYYLPSFEAAARTLKVTPIAAPVGGDAEIETVITSLGSEPGGGLIVMANGFMQLHRSPIILLAARDDIPAVYPNSAWAREGGLLSYGPDPIDGFGRAATYVDRILGGANPADLPVQLPVKFEMILNARTAKALGLNVPQSILLRADEVIE